MKATKIYSDDLEALTTAIKEAEGRATARTLAPKDVAGYLDRAESLLGSPSKKELKGTQVLIHASTEKLPSAYKYRAESTQAVFEHDGKGWVLVSVRRALLKQSCKPKFGLEITASDAAKAHLLDNLAFC